MSKIRVLPLPKVTAVWEHDYSKYPDAVRVPMSDGKVITYWTTPPMPGPVLRDALEQFDMVVGYERRDNNG